MSYSHNYSPDFPPLGDLSLNAFDSSENLWGLQSNDLSQSTSHPNGLIYDQGECQYSPDWSIPTWQSFDSSLPSTSYAHSVASSTWPSLGSSLFPTLCIPEVPFPPSPSDTCSSLSTEVSPSLRPESVHVVCKAPLVAPIPLPYHSPTFLQFDLPDIDEDLSHPPYTRRPAKRKYDGDVGGRASSKRRLTETRPSSIVPWHSSALSNRSHQLGRKRIRLPRHSVC